MNKVPFFGIFQIIPYVVAWAGSPKGAGASILSGKELVRFMNTLSQSVVTVTHVEAHLEEVMDGFAKHIQVPSFRGFGDSRKVNILEQWITRSNGAN